MAYKAKKGSWLKVGAVVAIVAIISAFNAAAITSLVNKYVPALGKIVKKS